MQGGHAVVVGELAGAVDEGGDGFVLVCDE
jgi:hypothetical protein